MLLASVTAADARENRADLIGDALRSAVAWSDLMLIVDTGINEQMVETAREIAGDKLHIVKWEGPKDCGNFFEIRNFGLDEAYRLGVDWACILDTDERMHTNGVDVKTELERIGSGTVLVPIDSRKYLKERFFKIPAKDRYIGGVHECVVPKDAKQIPLNSICFSEIPKTPEQQESKLNHMVDMLSKETDKDPDNPRWWYYLGDSLAGLGRDSEALKAFDHCAAMRGWDEESAWACFRMALLLEKMGRRRDAIDICAAGLTRHAGISELAWFAGEMSLGLGQADKAIYWARIAVANGTNYGESHFIRPRIGFQYPFGAKDGPYDLMARAYAELGMESEEAKCLAICATLRGNHDSD